MTDFLESCTKDEVCEALGGSTVVLDDLRSRLRDWLDMQPHLPKDITERRLEYFVISTKLSLEQAKQKLDMYYTVRRLVPELFADRDPLQVNFAQQCKTFQWISLPKLTPEKYRVSIFRAMDSDSSNFLPWLFFKSSFMIGEVRMSECRCLGDVYIYDLSNVRLGHFAKLSPTIVKKCEVTATKAYGARIKGIHFVNVPSFIDRIISFVKSTLKPKLASRIHVHSRGLESIYQFVPKTVLPTDYGGHELTMDELSQAWSEKLAEWRDWFLAQQSITIDETLRPDSTTTTVDADELFGFSGSFRKLDVD